MHPPHAYKYRSHLHESYSPRSPTVSPGLRRLPERVLTPRLARRGAAMATLALAALVGSAPAQQDGGVTGSVAPRAALTRLAGSSRALVGATALLRVSPRVEVGGGGLVAPSRAALDAGLEMAVGYGGLVVRVRRRPADRVLLSLLAGGLNVDVHDAVVGTTLASDNALVLEPSVEADLLTGSHLALRISAGWRMLAGVEDLPLVDASDLTGPSLSLSVAVGTFPP